MTERVSTGIMGTKLPRGVAAAAVVCAALALLQGCAQKGNPLEPGSDPGGYRIVGSLAIEGYAEDVEVTGDLCLVAASQGGMVLVDVSDPTDPVWLSAGTTGYPVPGCSYVASDSLAFAASGAQGIYVFDVSDLETLWADDDGGNHWSTYRGYDLDRNGLGDVAFSIQNVFQVLESDVPEVRFYLLSPAA